MDLPFDAIIFDFDGTLVQSNRIKRDTLFQVARSLGPVDNELEAVLAANTGEDRYGLYRQLLINLNGTAPDEQVEELCSKYERQTIDAISQAPEIPGAADFLRNAADSTALYIDSATPEEPLRKTIEQRGLSPFFHGIFGRPKSKPAILEMILTQNGYDTKQVLFVGDSLADLETARAHGCPFLGIAYEPGWICRFPENIPVINHYRSFETAAKSICLTGEAL